MCDAVETNDCHIALRNFHIHICNFRNDGGEWRRGTSKKQAPVVDDDGWTEVKKK